MSSFRFIFVLAGDMTLNPGPIKIINNCNMWDDLLFLNCKFPIDRLNIKLILAMITQIVVTNRLFESRGIHFIDLRVSNSLAKIEEMCHLEKPTNASVIGTSEAKLDGSVSNNEIAIEDYIRLDCYRKGGGVASFIKYSVA